MTRVTKSRWPKMEGPKWTYVTNAEIFWKRTRHCRSYLWTNITFWLIPKCTASIWEYSSVLSLHVDWKERHFTALSCYEVESRLFSCSCVSRGAGKKYPQGYAGGCKGCVGVTREFPSLAAAGPPGCPLLCFPRASSFLFQTVRGQEICHSLALAKTSTAISEMGLWGIRKKSTRIKFKLNLWFTAPKGTTPVT